MSYDPFGIIKDSSIWFNPVDQRAAEKRDPYVRIGMVKKGFQDKDGNYRYYVELKDKSDNIIANCKLVRRLGGIWNYEDVVHKGYNYFDSKPDLTGFDVRAGEMVLVVYLGGESREGIILGSLSHPGRKPELKMNDGPQIKSEFNGIETFINKDGEYLLTFKGQPTNLSALDSPPSGQLPKAEYDKKIGSTFMKFDKTGGWELNDNSEEDKQSIKIDKATGAMTFTAGKVTVVLNKKEENITVTSKMLTITVKDKVAITAKDLNVKASGTVKISSPKIAIGTDGIELFEQLLKLIEELGKVKPISPVGPCTPLMATPEWPMVEAIKTKLGQIKGSL